MQYMLGVFFFSSRRRHTRCSRDWSSDVCSSDLESPERLTKIGDPHHVELVQADEGAGVVPPHAGQTFHQAIVLLPLGEPPEPRQLVAHDSSLTPITRPSRIGATAATTRASLAPSRLNARTPSASAEGPPRPTTAPRKHALSPSHS